MSYDEFDSVLAKTIYGEARGEYAALEGGLSSLIAIGNVVINRLNARGFGRSIKEVCLKPFQFSCWNDGDPNKAILDSIDNKDEIFRLCLDVAKKVIDGVYPDLTKKSNHYHNVLISPYWSKGKIPQVKIGQHLFYKL